MNHHSAIKIAGILSGIPALALSFTLQAQDGSYSHVRDDLARGAQLQEVADRAFENADDYWNSLPPGDKDGDDEALSAGEAVTEIYTNAQTIGSANFETRDLIKVTTAVVDSWPDCLDTFDAIRAAVALQPAMAPEIVSTIAAKRDCNCSNGGLWLDRRVEDRIRVEQRHAILDVPIHCSCSQVAMYAGISGLPENREFNDALPAARKQELIDSMTEAVAVITERTAALQSKNGWECGCTDINIAASMQGIENDELRDGAYNGLDEKYSDEAGDTGLVVDSFGVVGTYPPEHWGQGQYASKDNALRRDESVNRGDERIMDDFDPQTEFTAHGDRTFDGLGSHRVTSTTMPVDVIISEYVEGWNAQAMALPPAQRTPEMRNRVVEIYNGSEQTIDLDNGGYFLEIYDDSSQGSTKPSQTITLSGAIAPGATHIVTYDGSDEPLKNNAQQVSGELDHAANHTLVLRKYGGERALYCRAQSYSFVSNYPSDTMIRYRTEHPNDPPGTNEVASPN